VAAFTFDGRTIAVRDGDTLASALHRCGERVLSRSLKYHRPRGLYCCTGSCAGCFVAVDGVPNVPACMTAAKDGLTVRSQNTLGGARRDLLAVVDKVYRGGFEPHKAFTQARPINAAFLKTVRLMSGVGRAPERPTPLLPVPIRYQMRIEHLVVGAGRQGLRAARPQDGAHPEASRTLVVDELPQAGGSARWDPTETDTAALVAELEAGHWPGVTLWTDTVAFGIYGDVVALRRGNDLVEVTAERITIAPGRHDAVPLFVNNDLPGVLSLRGARRLLFQHGVRPGHRMIGHGAPLPDDFVTAAAAAGGTVVHQGQVEAVYGGTSVEAATVDGRRIACDAVVCNLPGTPRVELFQQAGCTLDFSLGGLGPKLQDGQTSRPGLRAAFGGPA
jgi:sarcosine oxidase, subunit alpha